ncbi:tRNA (adenosine(37)-N6)-threonylcarbamoyltransferase complex ATPase subunit type 1 TsaE [Sphingomonas piscis]|uniref:tRNA threonylcarbamoyladenosine biosynthesis protein TsaE n=1 Tax=Sphingomonas piscis TaxID=2714943 RepID=A0A6G7YSI6_9SPHN|nr:tRNA (adenosine(37)-N6)-threonylcarbamoyltransferase complex ATPase subunit type 1 TsaE [Sphingomonas piscis]QIK79706.1 tRNA (adenosine(37)-N6)-threonylcarbamoyltransferase complex ATPase subunit type 1 TsaE [Sphingomonas piscis]
MILVDEGATRAAGGRLAAAAREGDVILLSGDLGAGKTTLARGFLEALGHAGDVPSPSFAIVQPYDALVPPVWHVDLYRIEDAGELAELGLDAADDGILLVEWPERAGEGAWPHALRLTLKAEASGARSLTAIVPPAWEQRWPFR